MSALVARRSSLVARELRFKVRVGVVMALGRGIVKGLSFSAVKFFMERGAECYYLRYGHSLYGPQNVYMGIGVVFDALVKAGLKGESLDADGVAGILDDSRSYDVGEVSRIGFSAFETYKRSGFFDSLRAVLGKSDWWSVDGDYELKVLIGGREVLVHGLPDLEWRDSRGYHIRDFKVSGALKPGTKAPCGGWVRGWDASGLKAGSPVGAFRPGRWERDWVVQQWLYGLLGGLGAGSGAASYGVEQCCYPYWYGYEWDDLSPYKGDIDKFVAAVHSILDIEGLGWSNYLGARQGVLDGMAAMYGYNALELLDGA